MNWKGWLKILGAMAAAPVTSTVGHWALDAVAGTHHPFTAGTILVPAIPIFIQSVLHLFQTPPHQS